MRVECPKCGNMLGYYSADGVMETTVSTNRGKRTWIGQPYQVQCERCQTVWTPPASLGGSATASAA